MSDWLQVVVTVAVVFLVTRYLLPRLGVPT